MLYPTFTSGYHRVCQDKKDMITVFYGQKQEFV